MFIYLLVKNHFTTRFFVSSAGKVAEWFDGRVLNPAGRGYEFCPEQRYKFYYGVLGRNSNVKACSFHPLSLRLPIWLVNVS